MTTDADLQHLLALDARLVQAAKSIKVLSAIEWPAEAAPRFLEAWHRGDPQLPAVAVRPVALTPARVELEAILQAAGTGHPLAEYLQATAQSCLAAVRMLENQGRPEFSAASIEIYGGPATLMGGGPATLLEAADHFLDASATVGRSCAVAEKDYCILPEAVAEDLRRVARATFTRHEVAVVLDPGLAAKAAAGAYRVRVRGGTCFAANDLPQLRNHEVLVHTLTLLNGREQPRLQSLGLGTPRTTRTQEGLALFSEFITNSIDLARLRRISARVRGVQLALEGADFLEVFRFFLEQDQIESESFQSAARIFRGGDPRGGAAFTKDVVYLQGFLEVHDFLLREIQAGHYAHPHRLFCGRLTTQDVDTLAPLFDEGVVIPPLYEPQWVANRGTLLAFLLYSGFAAELHAAAGAAPAPTARA